MQRLNKMISLGWIQAILDHYVESGQLITLFSAPDYPQFQVLQIIRLMFCSHTNDCNNMRKILVV